jgi:hypothetical protein
MTMHPARRIRSALAAAVTVAVALPLGVVVAAAPAQAQDGPMNARAFTAAVQKAAEKGAKSLRQMGGATLVVTPYKAPGQTGTVRQNLTTGWVKIVSGPTGSSKRTVTSFQNGSNVFSSPTSAQVTALTWFRLTVPRFVEDPTADKAYYPLATLLSTKSARQRDITGGLTGFTSTSSGGGIQLTATIPGTASEAVYVIDSQGRLKSVSRPAIGSNPAVNQAYQYRRPAFPVPPTRSVAEQSDLDAVTYSYTVRRTVQQKARDAGQAPTTALLLSQSRAIRPGAAGVARSNSTVTVTGATRVFTLQVFGATTMVTFRSR